MSTVRWSDGELRRFVVNAPSLSWGEETLAELARQRFGSELRHRVVPRVQARLLAKAGVPLSAEGVCLFAGELVEDSRYDRRRDWLLLCADPWEYLTDWVGDAVLRSYKSTIGRSRKDAPFLEGIAAASSRQSIEGPIAE